MNVINFMDHKQQREIEEQLARGRVPLFVSHLDGTIRAGDGMMNIKLSLDRINKLMKELKQLAETERRNENKSS